MERRGPVSDGVLLVNLGTPSAPTPQAVRAYLAEFLADPRVVELPRWLWLPLLHGVILNLRPARSARKYAVIWTAEGSPLAVHTARQARLLAAASGLRVEHAMRYGEPSVAHGLARLRAAGRRRIVVLPLYPQYARSTTESVRDVIGAEVTMIEQFHDHPAYIAALAAGVHRQWEQRGRGELLIMSFHGIPKRSVQRGDPYEKQCRETARLLAAALELKPQQWQLTYQSRFGAAEWLQPYTQPTLVALARGGLKRVDVVCPGFVADCLETLEEIGMEVRTAFLAAGGEEFRALPCLNEDPRWIEALGAIIRTA
ncbi:MAG: ferrochelatase [Betaproteobacteria bacterium]|nr:MAG: ferrochelatase [Betaproteobacteria bacterium]